MRKIVIVGILVAVVALAACPKDKATPTPTVGPSSGSVAPPAPEQAIAGQYLYAQYGVHAVMKPDEAGGWVLEVTNNTGHSLGKPALYALDAMDGHQISATLTGSEPLDNGKSETLPVVWDLDKFVPENIGLVILEFGEDNFGNFAFGVKGPGGAPTPSSSPAA